MEVRERAACLFFFCCVLLVSSRLQALELNGVASFGELGEETYLAGLYIDLHSSDPAEFFADYRERKMEMRFSSPVSRRRWVNNWMQSIAINNSRQHLEDAAEELSQVLSTFEGNLFRGDQVEIHYLPQAGTELRLNGHVMASKHSAAVFNLFLSSWLGPVPPSSQFRALLLGVEKSTDDRARFVALQPAAERIDAVASWASVAPSLNDTTTRPDLPPSRIDDSTDVGNDAVFEPVATVGASPATASTALVDNVANEVQEEGNDLDLSVAAILSRRDYLAQIIRDVYSNIRYPDRAVRRNYEGDVRVRLTIARDGLLAGMQVLHGARHEMLNEEAERAVRAAAPFAPIPAALRGDQIEVELPINFRLE